METWLLSVKKYVVAVSTRALSIGYALTVSGRYGYIGVHAVKGFQQLATNSIYYCAFTWTRLDV